MKVALFITCFNDVLFPRTGKAVVRVLEDLGQDVEFPSDQTCCGQIHYNTGYREEAFGLLERFLGIFGNAEVIVAPSASCVAMVREQYPHLAREAGNARLESEVRAVGARTFEMSEFLVGVLGVEDVGATFRAPVTFHPTCHSTRGIDVGDKPLRLLKSVRGLELLPLPNAQDCCGFGGTFSVKNPDTSLAMMADKIRGVRESGARVLTAVDNSCLMHLAGGLRRQGLLGDEAPGIRVLHLAEILAARERGQG